MATFYAAVDGDPLTSKGHVMASNGSMTIDDPDGRARKIACIDDPAFCAACGTVGIILGGAGVGDAHRLIDFESGKPQAVGGDLVACRCDVRPRIIATYGRSWMIETEGDSLEADSKTVAQVTSSFDEQVKVCAHVAMAGYPYLIELADGSILSGRLDYTRLLPRISTESADSYTILWGDEALAHDGWK